MFFKYGGDFTALCFIGYTVQALYQSTLQLLPLLSRDQVCDLHAIGGNPSSFDLTAAKYTNTVTCLGAQGYGTH